MTEHTGWLLDIYEDPRAGAALWLLCDDGQRRKLDQPFPVTCYAAGPANRLKDLRGWLTTQPEQITVAFAERRDLFEPRPVPVLAIETQTPGKQAAWFKRAARLFPDLTWYDADLALPLRHAARFGSFPLARLRLDVDTRGFVCGLDVLTSPWELDPQPAPLRVLHLEPDCDPGHAAPRFLQLRWEGGSCRLALADPHLLRVNLNAILRRLDPDLLLTAWGDTWLLPWLLERPEQPTVLLNRDVNRQPLHRPERSYMAYGQVVHRGRQVLLFGRWHLDCCNALLYAEYGLEGALESARVSGMPVQQAARLSPGSGISAMQVVTALRHNILVPWHKQQAEQPRSALDLLHADQGGLVYQPICGLHANVAELDFISMYPGIMARFNISPETHGPDDPPGLIPLTLTPLLDKRIALKQRIAELGPYDPQKKIDKARIAAHKWLLVTCFGYLGYKNARFGRIEAHQAVTAWSRECLLRAKEVAEEAGFQVLHLYVDGLWVQKPDGSPPGDLRPLLEAISERTGLPIALEGVYRWVAFLPSRVNERRSTANSYFGVFEDGSIKLRGIAARRHDTPPWVAGVQTRLLELLAQARTAADLPQMLPRVRVLVGRELQRLRSGQVALTELAVRQKLSRAVSAYRSPSPPARAAAQLKAAGHPPLQPGQYVRFIYTRGEPGVRAWDLPGELDPRTVDVARYTELLERAVEQVLGVVESKSKHKHDLWCLDLQLEI
ncbi:MAG TPA: DNA polymerase domain-containing protein [Anaerolineaceae bacterium]|nr:DNA polymerase domain-containing protein [Anaerolineaceae bacterium]HQH86361.1 DNA polymerase domain-containing protein [Anaerolineaceae bacterium]